jgi:hypothetical protein
MEDGYWIVFTGMKGITPTTIALAQTLLARHARPDNGA